MKIETTGIEDCYLISPRLFEDHRGSFVKTWQVSVFQTHGLTAQFVEDFYSFSKKNVIRGMHFQTPPFDHIKLVTCLAGRVWDVVLDLRKESATYGVHIAFLLDSAKPNALWIPKGCAHGFLALEEQSCVYYKVSSEHNPAHDTGIHWNSFGHMWPISEPIVSEKDSHFMKLADFDSPF